MKHTLIALLATLLLVSCGNNSTDWTKWRGPNATGIANSSGWDQQIDSTNILWTKNVGKGHSAITVLGNLCFVSGWEEIINEIDTLEQSTMFCLNTETGKEVWKYTYPSAKRSYPGPRTTPVINEDRLYFLSWEGLLACVNLEDGSEVWKRDIYSDSLVIRDRWGFCTSPVFYKDLLLLNLGKAGIAFDKTNGQMIWQSEKGSGGFSSATLFERDGKTLGTFTSDSSLYIVDVSNGEIQMSYTADIEFRRDNEVMLTSNPDELFISNEMLKIEDRGLESLWRNDTVASYFRTGVVIGNYAYQFNNYKRKMKLTCVDLSNGEPQWQHEYDIWGAVSAIDNKLVVLTGFGKLAVVEATPEAYKELTIWQVLPGEKNNKNWCWTMPVYANNKIFVRNSNGDMACLDVSVD